MQEQNTEISIAEWSPSDWYCNCFPMPAIGCETVDMADLVALLHTHISTATEADTTPLGAALHVAHILMTLQESDGSWPETLDFRTGEATTPARTISPVSVLRRLDALLDAREFDFVCERAEAGNKATTV